ncbi:unnamed protein product [Caenorhabditis brenneri]
MNVFTLIYFFLLIAPVFCDTETNLNQHSIGYPNTKSISGIDDSQTLHLRQRRWGGYYGGFGGPFGWGWRRPFGWGWRRPFFGGWGMPFGGFGGYPFWGR